MTWQVTAKLRVFAALVVLGCIAGLGSGRPEPVMLVAPVAMAVAIGLASTTRPPALAVHTRLARSRVTEGDEVVLLVGLRAETPIPELGLAVTIPHGLSAAPATRCRTVGLAAGERRRLETPVRALQWGSHDLGEVWVRARGPFGMMEAEGHIPHSGRLVVYPHPDALRRLVRAGRTQLAAGNQLARVKASGVEFADLRAFVPGDRVREINWRATARRGAPWVNDRHPDRSTDVVLFLDAFDSVALSAAVRAAASLATAYLSQRDRVGLVSFGGIVTWLRAGSGLRQHYRIVDALLATDPFENAAWRGVNILPRGVLPPSALVLAVSPLQDARVLRALLDLHDRGIDLVVIEVSPLPFVSPKPGLAGDIAHRLWRLQRDVVRERYQSLGVPVVEWREDRPLVETVEAVSSWRRANRR